MRGEEANPYLVDIEAVLETAIDVKELFPDDIYIYFLIRNNEVVYVGQTTQLMMRIGYHTTCKTFDSINYFKVKAEMANLIEAMMRVKFVPPLNNAMPRQELYVSYQQLKQVYGLSRRQIQNLIGKDFVCAVGNVYVEMSTEKYQILEEATL